MKRLRQQLTYANVAATLALVVAVGTGSSYAIDRLNGARLENRSVAGKKIKRNALTRKEIREGSLRTVPRAAFAAEARRAQDAEELAGRTVDDLLVGCRGETTLSSGVCVERRARIPQSYLSAVRDCNFNRDRHLPTHDQLVAALDDPQIELAPGGEFVAPVVALADGSAGVAVVTDEAGGVSFVQALGNEQRAFRCVASPTN